MDKRKIAVGIAAVVICGAAYVFFRPVKIYKPDGSELVVSNINIQEYLNDGWSAVPVRTMYSTDGRQINIAEDEIDGYIEQNWFTEPPMKIYASDGSDKYIIPSELEKYEGEGWYSEPVTVMYADDGRTMYVKESEIDTYLGLNWYLQMPEKEGLVELKDNISQYLSNRSGEWGVFIQSLVNNEYLSINEKSYSSASLIKLFTMPAVFNELACGSFEETEDIDYLLDIMITESSNDACNKLTEILGGGGAIKGFDVENNNTAAMGCEYTTHGSTLIDETGGKAVFVTFNVTSPRDCGRVLKQIYDRTLVSPEASDRMLDLLKRQTRTWKIPAALPEGTVTANKTGENDTVQADAAIVYSPTGDFIVCAIGNGSVANGVETIQHIARTAYDYFNPQQ